MASHSHDPYDSPPLRGIGAVQGTLRVFVALQCWGYAAAHLHFGARSAIARMLETEFFLSPGDTGLVDLVCAGLLTVGGITCLIRPNFPVLLGVFTGQLLFVASKAWLGEGGHPVLVVARHAVPLASPLLLCAADFWPLRPKFSLGVWIGIAWLMQLAIIASFLGNGLACLVQSQHGGELVSVSSGFLAKVCPGCTSSDARLALAIVGALQVSVGLSLAFSRTRVGAAFGAAVGFFVAGSYAIGLGMNGYPRGLTHLILGGLPTALSLFWSRATVEGEMRYVPEPGVFSGKK